MGLYIGIVKVSGPREGFIPNSKLSLLEQAGEMMGFIHLESQVWMTAFPVERKRYVRHLDTPPEPQSHRPNRRWMPRGLYGPSPDTRRTLTVDNNVIYGECPMRLRRGWGVATGTAWSVLLAAADTSSERPKCPSSRVLHGFGALAKPGAKRQTQAGVAGWPDFDPDFAEEPGVTEPYLSAIRSATSRYSGGTRERIWCRVGGTGGAL